MLDLEWLAALLGRARFLRKQYRPSRAEVFGGSGIKFRAASRIRFNRPLLASSVAFDLLFPKDLPRVFKVMGFANQPEVLDRALPA